MNKEKVIFKNGTELEFDSISASDTALVIGIIGADATELETVFRAAGQENLEEIRQTDAGGTTQATHLLYDILAQITVHIDAAGEEGRKQNLIEVTLAKEEAWEAEIRRLKKQIEEMAGGGDPEVIKNLDKRITGVENDVVSIGKAITGGK